jgi:hypothetical protein
MMDLPLAQYGPFAELIRATAALVATAATFKLSFRGRAKWEPSEEDVPKGAQKVVGLITAVLIGAIWFWLRSPSKLETVTNLAIYLAFACLAFLLLYGFFINVLTYEQTYAISAKKVNVRKIIGGLWLKSRAKEALVSHGITVQELLANSAYNPDKVWPRTSRGLAKMGFVLCYVGLVSTGTVALCCAGILITNSVFSR